MNMDAFIKELKGRKDLSEIVHHEVIPGRDGVFADTSRPLSAGVRDALEKLGISSLYSHQARGVDLVRDGRNLVVMTPTASGKSLIYNIPVAEALLEDPEARALYLFPLKGLEQDQLKAFRELTENLLIRPEEKKMGGRKAFSPGVAEIYDGDTTAYRRKKIREAPPSVVLTNPDMLHLAINPFHQKWESFFRNLRFVIIDEVHSYRGVFGSHVANVLRRLRRIAAHYGSEPVFIACSATIANPTELAGMLTGLDFELIEENGAPRGKRNFIFLNPAPGTSPNTAATKLFISSVRAGFKTIAFTKARKTTELMHTWIKEGAPDVARSISSYRAGFLPEERREIEEKLFAGELSGVVSTSALELGVDIGGLDVCVLAGYPGTVSSTWQRGGRAGRTTKDSLIVMVAHADALDQYFMRNPKDFFRRSSEAAVLDPENGPIVKAHLMCAVAEQALKGTDEVYDVPRLSPILEELQAEARIRHWVKGDIWYPRKRYPHPEVSIRGAGQTYSIVKSNGAVLGETSSSRVFTDLHPGAVYLHKGEQFTVTRLYTGERKAVVRPADDIYYYTRPMTEEDTEIISVDATRRLPGTLLNFGTLRVTGRVVGYRKIHTHTGANLGEVPLELPPTVFTTKGVWFKVGEDTLEEIKERKWSPSGALHAAEHAAIASLPLFTLCDRMDLGGVSYPYNPELESPAIFIYDGHEGGVGLTGRGLECAPEWFSATIRLMEECDCEVACPSCTQDPKCGNNNEPLDKRGAVLLLKRILGQ